MERTPASIIQNYGQPLGLLLGGCGLLGLITPALVVEQPLPWTLGFSLFLMTAGVMLYSLSLYRGRLPGIKNNDVWIHPLTSRGWAGWLLASGLTVFYILIYFYPQHLGYHPEGNTGIVGLFDPLSVTLNGKPATQWFVYGLLYTLAIVVFGVKFIMKYQGQRYQIIRTLVLMFFQLGFAFFIPELLALLHPDTPYFAKDIKNMWPLNYYFFDQWHLKNMLNGGRLGLFFFLSGLAMTFLVSPFLTYRYGKRWYCSWVCGCGALAETAGDPFRQLSSKKISVWKLERWSIHVVLVLVLLSTISVIWSFLRKASPSAIITAEQFIFGVIGLLAVMLLILLFAFKNEMRTDARFTLISLGLLLLGLLLVRGWSGENNILFFSSYSFTKWYGFFIGAIFSGVLGVGFYPLLGSRVWCRFGCPMAAILGLQQRLFSRFRITTNGGQCISCGNCSAYCEMGIDVRAYAQRGQNIVRSSCVGCGICATVCPRGVLKLENGTISNRTITPSYPLGNTIDKQ